MSGDRPCMRTDTLRVTPCLCQTEGFQCRQGRACPARDTELSNVIPLREELPMNLRSSNQTGRFARTMNAALGCDHNDPVYPMPDAEPGWFVRLVRRIFGR